MFDKFKNDDGEEMVEEQAQESENTNSSFKVEPLTEIGISELWGNVQN